MYLKPEFAALLQNNDAPSASTILEVTESLKVPLNELQEIDAEIQRLDELMQTMKTKRQRIQEIIDDHNIILSAARRLPLDVIHEIFLHCIPIHHNPVMKSSESPLLLTRICSSWRAIALSCPRLWSKIHIPLPGDPSFSELGYGIITDETRLTDRRRRFAGVMRSRCNAVRRWLSRSGTCPLSLSVTYSGDHLGTQDSTDDELIQEMFGILLSSADRWRDVDLSMPEAIHDELQSNISPTTFSSLESLTITLHRKYRWDSTDSAPIRLLAAPGLRRLTINGIKTTLHITGILIQPIWTPITHITFTSATTGKHLLILLRQCPNLIFGNFIVNCSHWPDQTVVDQGEVFLPCLETLAINDSGEHEIMTIIFNAIKAPALTRLLYQRFDHRSYEDIPLVPLITPVIPLLETSALISDLSLDGLSSQDIQECLQRGTRVTHVILGNPPLTSDFSPPPLINPDVVRPDPFDLKTLSIGSVAMTLLPRLEFLEAYLLSSLTDEDLLDVITTRINAFKRGETAALKVVKIHFQRYRQRDITEDVSRLAKEAGIEIKLDLEYPPESPKLLDRLSTSYGLAPNRLGTCPRFTISVFPEFKRIHNSGSYGKSFLEGIRIEPM